MIADTTDWTEALASDDIQRYRLALAALRQQLAKTGTP